LTPVRFLAAHAGGGVDEGGCPSKRGRQLPLRHVDEPVLSSVLEVEQCQEILGGPSSIRVDLSKEIGRISMILRAGAASEGPAAGRVGISNPGKHRKRGGDAE